MYRKSCLQDLMWRCKSKGYAFQMEIVVKARELRYSIAEVTVDSMHLLVHNQVWHVPDAGSCAGANCLC